VVNLFESTAPLGAIGGRVPQWGKSSQESGKSWIRANMKASFAGALRYGYATKRAQKVICPGIPICAKL
jgi:hypothetical protein